MALIEVCGKIIDTRIKFSGAPALKYAEEALEKEIKERKKEEKERILSIEYSKEYLALRTKESQNLESPQNPAIEFTDSQKTKEIVSNSFELYYQRDYFRLDLLI
ncbi:hypothetical protein [Campylobacter cuniculorum]|uniref:Uncharacterized protein n=2 Tax=Campylobacter cuniculorum TaxID=374106 RepID=A0A1W6BUH5_9BACT|nr:hypothetical protein [Campylobacter cuniculorum]ARJ55724.1 hypothetical protein CCUN_0056 [Campylobacter cuniculorum DSM 23162 = LMG 24588]QOR04945.1 hypothetical protein A0071_03135 [Campylobacter cuniculorum]